MDISIDTLIPTHDSLRNANQIYQMIRFVEDGRIFNRLALDNFAIETGIKASPLIQISIFEDGEKYIHDGHHRVFSVYIGGRDKILEEEYEVTKWKYRDYLEINFEEKWVTPFDPKTEIRIADLREWKKNVLEMKNTIGFQKTVCYIMDNRTSIIKPRRAIDKIWQI